MPCGGMSLRLEELLQGCPRRAGNFRAQENKFLCAHK